MYALAYGKDAKYEKGAAAAKTRKAPMSVKLPSGCTSKEDCSWICDKMAGATGANMNAIDMNELDSTDGESADGENPEKPKAKAATRLLAAAA